MKNKTIIAFFFILFKYSLFSQVNTANCENFETINGNWWEQNTSNLNECSNDARLGNNSNYCIQMYNADENINICDKDHATFDGPMTVSSRPSLPNAWQRVYYDDFKVLDRGFWYSMQPGGNVQYSDNSYGISMPQNSEAINGRLVQKITRTPGAVYPSMYVDGSNVFDANGNPTHIQSDYITGAVSSVMAIPINSKIQGSIKMLGANNYTWPAFWLFGNNQLEIDIYEVMQTGSSYDDSEPGKILKANVHRTLYGYPNNSYDNRKRSAGVSFYTDYQLSDNFHLYELIWDPYKIQWGFDGSTYHEEFNYFDCYSWGQNKVKRHWRKFPANQPSDVFVNNDDHNYLVNRYFPSNNHYAMNIILSGALNANISNPSSIAEIEAQRQETDWFAFWVRSNCLSGFNAVQNLSFYDYSNGGYSKSAYETGYNIYVTPQEEIVLDGVQQHAIFAATNEIYIASGFTVNPGSYFLAHITPCEAATDYQRTSNRDSILAIINVEPNGDSLYTGRIRSNFEEFSSESSFVNIETRYDKAQITSANEKIIGVELLDLTGKVLFRENNINLNQYLFEGGLIPATGIYLIRVYGTQNIQLQKIWLSVDK